MRQTEAFRAYLSSLPISDDIVQLGMDVGEAYESFLNGQGGHADSLAVSTFLAGCNSSDMEPFPRLVALARYCKFHGRNEDLAYLLTMANTVGVVQSMEERMKALFGVETARAVFSDPVMPPLGSAQDAYPKATQELLERMQEHLERDRCRQVLTGNHHQIPESAFAQDKEKFEQLDRSIDAYLEYRRNKTLDEMQDCMAQNKLWYEQRITEPVIRFLREHPEVQTGVRIGNRIVVDKIPYRVDEYLRETDPRKKRYLACHCPFVRSSLQEGAEPVDDLWCNCTGGFTKFPYEVLYGQDLEVELLESVLSGGDRCRFAITLPNQR